MNARPGLGAKQTDSPEAVRALDEAYALLMRIGRRVIAEQERERSAEQRTEDRSPPRAPPDDDETADAATSTASEPSRS